MKSFLFFMAFTSTSLFADSVIIEIDGVRHQCSPIEGSRIDCIESAYSGPFSRIESEAICEGSFSTSPAKCALAAYRGRFNRVESIRLCIGSMTDTGPVDCTTRAYNGPFSHLESLELCEHNGSERIANCALKAYGGAYTKEQAIAMCKNANFLAEKSSEFNVSKNKIDSLIKKANLKAFKLNEYK